MFKYKDHIYEVIGLETHMPQIYEDDVFWRDVEICTCYQGDCRGWIDVEYPWRSIDPLILEGLDMYKRPTQ